MVGWNLNGGCLMKDWFPGVAVVVELLDVFTRTTSTGKVDAGQFYDHATTREAILQYINIFKTSNTTNFIKL